MGSHPYWGRAILLVLPYISGHQDKYVQVPSCLIVRASIRLACVCTCIQRQGNTQTIQRDIYSETMAEGRILFPLTIQWGQS